MTFPLEVRLSLEIDEMLPREGCLCISLPKRRMIRVKSCNSSLESIVCAGVKSLALRACGSGGDMKLLSSEKQLPGV